MNVLYEIFKDYGLQSIQIILLCYFGLLITKNHLKHIQDNIEKLFKITEALENEMKDVRDRISNIEGKLS